MHLRDFTPKSLVLVLLGAIFILIGLNATTSPWRPEQREVLFMLAQLAPRDFWGGAMIVAGSCSVLSSLWPTWNDSWGFAALSALSMWWACAYLAGVIAVGGTSAVAGMLTWLAFCVLLWAISRLQDPVRAGRE